MKKLILMLVLVAFFVGLNAQTTSFGMSCGTDILHELLSEAQTGLSNKEAQIESEYHKFAEIAQKKVNQPTILILPVVVHIIHDNGPENIPDAQVLQGIENLNDAFRNRNYYDPATGADTEIEFCLAGRTPNGQPTNGIVRHHSPLTDMSEYPNSSNIASLATWNPQDYINRLV